ncbi:MAG TPA: FAD-binding oxidoreductase [Solirubrobacteraceae bacterium]|nr:FAD-binding oxidoreductase [Solirubrobacteraceae bacterium]
MADKREMLKQADVVVIGSGGLGAATAFYLVKRGAERVVLVDRYELGSQTSPRAAGMAAQVRPSDLMVHLMKLAREKLTRFTEDTGQPLEWSQPGSLKVARRAQDLAVLESERARARRFGFEVELISPEAAHQLNPFLEPRGVLGVMHVPEDLVFEPSQVAIGFARGAQAHGARMLPHTTVTRVQIDDGQVTSVVTDEGTISTPVVVDTAGAWTRQVAAASGIRIPIIPTRHQLFTTEPLTGVRADLPMVRIMDAAVYMRPYKGGLLWGGFEESPRQFDMDALSSSFQIKDMELDPDVLWRLAVAVKEQLPILLETTIREHRGGLPTMTADGLHIVGPAPAAHGFFIAGGCNVAGLSISPAIGDALAAWILEGAPPLDLAALSIERFATQPLPEQQLESDAVWQYHHFYGTA